MERNIVYIPSEYIDTSLTGKHYTPEELPFAPFVAGTLRYVTKFSFDTITFKLFGWGGVWVGGWAGGWLVGWSVE